MVRSTEHTCKECNKKYASYQSLCNHRTKFHKTANIDHGKHEVNINNDLGKYRVNIDNQSTLIKNETVKQYNCRKCNKVYKYKQSRWFHEKSCNEIIPNNTSISDAKLIIENQNNGTINTHNTNNGTITNIVINNYGTEDIKYITDNFMLRIIDNLSKNTDESLKKFIPLLIENMHLNENHKNNNNIQFNNMKSPVAKTYIDNKWTYTDKDKLIEELHDDKVNFTEKWIKNNKDKAPTQSKEKLNIYKKIPKSYKKKNIYPEINKSGYLYYKTNMENELDN